MKKSILPLFPILILCLLLSRPSLSLEGARDGLLLWFDVVLPTILPFMLCSSLIVAWDGVDILTRPFRPIFKLFGLSSSGSYALMAGLLCGYPMGAKTTADFLRQHKLSVPEGKRLLAMAAWPSPMFVAGYVRSFLEPGSSFGHLLLAIYLPLPALALLSALVYRSKPLRPAEGIPSTYENGRDASVFSKPFDDLLMDSLEVMVKIGGYIMLFSILALFVKELLPDSPIKPLALGFVEMTTGIRAIASSMKGVPASAAIASAAVFGGLSGVSQTGTVIKNAGLSIRHYTLWKLLHAGLSSALFILLSYR